MRVKISIPEFVSVFKEIQVASLNYDSKANIYR
jgi:hypothetical protein